jgi:hypothetical protein
MKVALTVIAGLSMVVPAASGAAVSSSARWTATMAVPTHTPRAGRDWPVKIVAKTAGGRRLRGSIQYKFIFGGQIVSTAGCHPSRPDPCPFFGTYRDVVRWPARSEGYRLTFRAVVKTRLGTKNLDWWVKVRP